MGNSLAVVIAHKAIVISALRNVGPVAADKAIEDFADQHGDKKTATLIGKLGPLVVADIVKEFDSTKMGMAGMLLTPVGLKDVVEHLPLLDSDVRRLKDTLCAVILQHEKMTVRGKYFKEIAKSNIGAIALAAVFTDIPDGDFQEKFLTFAKSKKFDEDDEDVAELDLLPHGDREELCFSLYNSSRHVFERVLFTMQKAILNGDNLPSMYNSSVKKMFGSTSSIDDPYAVVS